jgi:hypothetical protein
VLTSSGSGLPGGIVLVSDTSLVYTSSHRLIFVDFSGTLSITYLTGYLSGFADGIGTSTKFNYPRGLEISTDRTFLLIADQGNGCIRKLILSTKVVSTLVSSGFTSPIDIQLNPFDESYFLVADPGEQKILRVFSSAPLNGDRLVGFSTGYQDGIGSNSLFDNPSGVALSRSRKFALIADSDNNRIRMVNISSFEVTTIAGTSSSGISNGVGTNAGLSGPYGIRISSDDSFALITDSIRGILRKIILSTYEVVSVAGLSPGVMNGVGTNAKFSNPTGLCINSLDNAAFLVDGTNSNLYVRKIILMIPTNLPTQIPTRMPSSALSSLPSRVPTITPTRSPTSIPSLSPTLSPTSIPSLSPTLSPTSIPSPSPTRSPTSIPSPSPTRSPTSIPTLSPTSIPSHSPTLSPTPKPSSLPADPKLSAVPSISPQSFSVLFLGPSVIDIPPSHGLSLEVVAFLSGQPLPRTSCNYTWKISLKNSSIVFNSLSNDHSYLKLRPYFFVPRGVYVIQVLAVYYQHPWRSQAKILVRVTPEKIIPRISGGLDRVLPHEKSLIIDAHSSSLDSRNDSSGLTFNWSCLQISPTPNQCSLLFSTLDTKGQGSILGISTNSTTKSNSTAKFILVLTITSFDSIASANISIHVVPSSAPFIDLHASSASITSGLVGTSFEINEEDDLRVEARISSTNKCSAKWIVNDLNVNLKLIALTEVEKWLPGGNSYFNLVLAFGSLAPKPSDYVFTLTCGGVAVSVSIVLRTFPHPGTFQITPSSGIEYQTLYHLSASQWLSDNLPLQYLYGFIHPLGHIILKDLTYSSEFSTYLPSSGEENGNNFTLGLFLRVSNSLGATFHSFTSVQVRPLSTLEDTITILSQSLESNQGDFETTLSLVSFGAMRVNQVSCSTSPDCQVLHRSRCKNTPNTCGACLEGYIGVDGDSNSPCVSPTFNRTQGPCSMTSECDQWSQCNEQENICSSLPLLCHDNCEDHGDCHYLNLLKKTNSTNQQQNSCDFQIFFANHFVFVTKDFMEVFVP